MSEVQRVLAVFLFALVLWLLKPVPYTVSSLLSVSLLYVFDITDTLSAAFSGFASSLVMFLLVLFLLGDAIAGVGLDRWIARRLLASERTRRGAYRALSGAVLATATVMPSATARATTFAPIVEQLSATLSSADGQPFDRASFALLGHVNPIASMALMTGGGMALVTSQIVTETVYPISWVQWAVVMVPPVVVLYALATVCVGQLHGISEGNTRESEQANRSNEPVSPNGQSVSTETALSREQRIVALVMAGALLGWVVGSFSGVPALIPGVLAVTVLSLPRIRVLTAADIKNVSWGILFLIASTLSILDAMQETGAVAAVIDGITAVVPLTSLSHWQLVVFFLTLAIAVRVAFSTGTAAIVVVLPVILEFAGALGVNRLYIALSVLLVVGSTTVFPFNTTAVLVAMDRGPLGSYDVVRFGLMTMGCSLLVVTLSWLLYWPLVV